MDHGQIARGYTAGTEYISWVPYANSNRLSIMPIPFQYQFGTISGVASKASGVTPNVRVSLYWMKPLKCIGVTRTNADGEYEFRRLPMFFKYLVVCESPPGSPAYRPLAHIAEPS